MMHRPRHTESPQRSFQRGFTLIEFMVVMAVMIILIAIAIPAFREVMANQRARAAANDLLASLHLARSEAIKRNAAVYVVASTGDNGWADGWAITTSSTDTYETCDVDAPPTTCLRVHEAMANMSVSLNDDALTSVTYLRDGRFTAATATPEFSFCIPLAGQRNVTINLIGTPKVTVDGVCS